MQTLEKLNNIHPENPRSTLIETLTYFNMNPTQIRVYLYLSKRKADTPRSISEAIGIHRTEAYKTVKELELMGLVTRNIGTPATYTALGFRTAINTLIYERWQTLLTISDRLDALEEDHRQLKYRTKPRRDARTLHAFTVMRKAYLSRIKKLNETSQTRHYHLTLQARAHLNTHLPEDEIITYNQDAALGSFIVYDNDLFLLRQLEDESWQVTHIQVPEIVAAYQKLYSFIEAQP